MEEFLTEIYSNSSIPVISALILGLMTAISPCPLATNITAIGFISKDLGNKNRVFISGLIYTLGRIVSYTLLATIIYFGADQISFSGFFQQYGEKILGPLLIIFGILLLNVIKINIPGLGSLSDRFQEKGVGTYWESFLLGVLFALAFCPYSGVLFFGMLMPLTLSSSSGLILPVIYALATGIPVIIIAWLLAYTISGVGSFYKNIKTFEFWFRKVIAVLFIIVGIYYIYIVYIG
ncbi:aromatic aminobenezylarsenical efflux permease ArsG family transporter [Bacteroidota bacterium]